MPRATAAFGANRFDDMFRLLNEAYETRDPLLALMGGNWPPFDVIRGRPEYRAVLARMGWTTPLADAPRPPAPPS